MEQSSEPANRQIDHFERSMKRYHAGCLQRCQERRNYLHLDTHS
jgi:hypothetical protein